MKNCDSYVDLKRGGQTEEGNGRLPAQIVLGALSTDAESFPILDTIRIETNRRSSRRLSSTRGACLKRHEFCQPFKCSEIVYYVLSKVAP